MLKANMPSFNDEEGHQIPRGLPPVIDAHVHVFPQDIFQSVWKWFDVHAWHIRYQMTTTQAFDFLLSKGIRHIIALQYAHKPGIARQLNHYLALRCDQFRGRVSGMATVLPGEKDTGNILQEAFDAGLKGVKLHVHVQCFDMNAGYMNRIYECCCENDKPVVIHAGREPKSQAYKCDPYEICSSEKLETILKDYPELKICVPHLGFDETAAYRNLIEKYDTLWLDTTMAITDYFKHKETISLENYRKDRIMYGSDFPNIPYAWDRELKALQKKPLSMDRLEHMTWKNAADFFKLDLQD